MLHQFYKNLVIKNRNLLQEFYDRARAAESRKIGPKESFGYLATGIRYLAIGAMITISKFSMLIFESPENVYKVFAELTPETERTTSDVVQLRDYQKKVRVFSLAGIGTLIAAVAIVSLVLNLILPGKIPGYAATFTQVWTTTGDFDSNSSTNQGNTTKTNVITTGDKVELSSNSASVAKTSDADFSGGTLDQTQISSNSVKLVTYQTKVAGDANLVSYWKMDNNWNDSKGTNHGTATGAIFSTGVQGTDYKYGTHAGSFDGVNDKVNIATDNVVQGIGDFTFETWAKPTNWLSNFVWFNAVTAGAGYNQLMVGTYGSVDGRLRVKLPNGATEATFTFATNMNSLSTPNDWHHYVVTRNGSTLSLYRDGVFIESIAGNADMPGATPANRQYIGIAYDGINYPFSGLLDEMAIYNTALSASVIQEHSVAYYSSGNYASPSINLGQKSNFGNLDFNKTVSAYPETSGMVSYWKNDNNWNDSKGTNHGTATGATFGAAKYGSASGSFDGTDYVDFGNNASLQITGSVTLEAWVKTTDTNTAEQVIVAWHYSTVSKGWFLEKFNNRAYFWHGGSGDRVDSGVTINDGVWHHIVGVLNTSTGKQQVYVDGAFKAEISGSSTLAPSANVVIGSIVNPSPGGFFNGLIDEMAIYNTALSAAKITEHYNGSAVKFQVAANNDNSTWNYVGPDNTASTYFTATSTAIPAELDNNQYIKYKAFLSTANSDYIPSLDDITLNYSYYNATGTITNLKMDAGADANFTKIEWNGATPSGTEIKFRTRGVPNAQFSNDCSTTLSTVSPGWSQSYYTTSGATLINDVGAENPTYRCIEVELTLATNEVNTPTLNDFILTYAQNVTPEVQITSPQPTQGASGLIPISFQVRDTDTGTGTIQSGYVDATVEYCSNYTTSCQTWVEIPAAALDWGGVGVVGATVNARKLGVNTSTPANYTSYSVTWNPNTDIPNSYLATTQIRVVANDREGVNNQGLGNSSTFELDTTDPVSVSKRILASQSDGTATSTLILGMTDNSPAQMMISNNANMSADGVNADSGNWIAYGADSNADGYGDVPLSVTVTKNWSFGGDPATVYFKFRDKYGNETGITTYAGPRTPTKIFYKDISNIYLTPFDYKEFFSWGGVSEPTQGFGYYQIYRSTDGGASYSQLGSNITEIATNYIIDSSVSAPTIYYYKVRTVTAGANDYSSFSTPVFDDPNGQGGTDITAPTISSIQATNVQTNSATITWTTDEYANTTVLSEGSPTFTNKFVNEMVTSHSTTITGLTPNTTYSYKVRSADPNDNTTTSGVQTFKTLDGATISNVHYDNLTDTAATIIWNTDVSSDSNVKYNISATMTGASVVSDSALVSCVGNSCEHRVSVTGLTRATKYYYQVESGVAIDNNAGNFYDFTTTQDSTPPTISVTNPPPIITTTSAAIAWSTSEPSTSQVCYNLIPEDLANCTTLDTGLVTTHNVFISGLSNDTKYYYRARSRDAQSNLTESDVYNFTTSRLIIGGGGGGGGTAKDVIPPQIIRPQVSNITDTQALITWESDEEGSSFVEYGSTIQYGELAGRFEDKIKHTVQLLKLNPGTDYHFRVITQDATGNKGYSGDLEFKTLGTREATVGEISQIQSLTDISQITRSVESLLAGLSQKITPPKIAGGAPSVETTSTSALITWVTDRPSNSLVAFASESEYQEDAEEPYIAQMGDPDEQVVTHKVLLANLLPGATYHYQLRSKGLIGDLGKSDDMTFTTKSEASIFGLEISDITKDSVTIKWKTNIVTTSRVQYGLSTDYGLSVSDPSFNTSHNVKLTNLNAGTFYHFRVGGIDQQRVGFWSPDLTFTTTALPSLINVKINEVGAGSLIVSWNTNIPSDSVIEYTNLRTNEKLSFGDKSIITNHLLKVENLAGNTEYEFTVSSTDANQNTITSSPYRIQTVSDTFGPDITQVQSQSAVAGLKGDKIQTIITWKTDEPSTSRVIYQEGVTPNPVLEKSTPLDKAFAQNHTAVVTIFKPGTVYRYRVESVDSSGNIAVSKDFTMLTPSQRETVIDLIIKNFQDIFGWTQRLR